MTERPARPGSDNILVSGLGKTGTSGVYASIKQALASAGFGVRTMFEPSGPDAVYEHFHHAPDVPLLIKIILQDLHRMDLPPKAFDRRVMTVRDPRDTAISALLFRPLIKANLRTLDDAGLERFVDALRRKEADPSSVSVLELYRLTAQLGLGAWPRRLMVDVLAVQLRMINAGGFHIVRYEDFVAGRLDGLSEYLGLPVTNVSTQGSAVYGHTSRSEGTGSFRDWFTAEDLAVFNRRWGRFLRRTGYPLEIDLTERPTIDPTTSSVYVRENFLRRREQLRRGGVTALVSDVEASASYDDLCERAAAGDVAAGAHAARIAAGSGRIEEAVHLARDAARAGSVEAMALLASLLEGTEDAAVERTRLGWLREAHARQSDSERAIANELNELRRSTSLQLGNALVRAAHSPRRDGPAALRTALRLLRTRRKTGR